MYPNVCWCRTVCNDLCKTKGGSVAVYAGFLNGAILLQYMASAMLCMQQSLLRCTRSSHCSASFYWCIWGSGVNNIVFAQSVWMAVFVKWAWMCMNWCWGIVLRSPVYCTCRVVSMLCGEHVVACVSGICTGCS